MNCAFVRGLWGEININRHPKIILDIDRALSIDKGLNFVCYTFGEENHDYLQKRNIESILVDSLPNKYAYTWRHKLDIYKFAMLDYDEIVYLDWNCNIKKDIPTDFWNELSKKDPIQGCLYRWSNKNVCPWRKEAKDRSYLINNGFLYIRDKCIPNQIIDIYNKFPNKHIYKRNDETVTTYYIDKLMDGWKGVEYWLQHYEPECCDFIRSKMLKKNVVFYHYKTAMNKCKYIVEE